MAVKRFTSRESISVLSVHAWCGKCMSSTYMYQPKPLTDPLLMKCETCGQPQNAYTTELREACISETGALKDNRKNKKSKE